MEYCPVQVWIEFPELPHCVDALLFFNVIPHLKCDNLSVEAVYDGRNIQFAVRALHLGDVREELSQRLLRAKVPLQKVFVFLNFCCGSRDSMWNALPALPT